MNRTTMGAASAFLLLVGMVPATAYHIDPVPSSTPDPNGGPNLYVSDWVKATGNAVNACESLGLLDDRNDNVNAIAATGGPCTAGENDATGTWAPGQTLTARAATPGKGAYVRFDICEVVTRLRIPAAWGAFPGGAGWTAGNKVPACAPAQMNEHFFAGRVGAFQCDVPSASATTGFGNTVDYGLYYDRLYAYWSYDGDGFYTTGFPVAAGNGDFGNMAHSGNGAGINNFANANNPTGSDNEDAYHGHVAAFIDFARSDPAASVTGSVSVSLAALPFANNLSDLSANAFGGLSNNCGGSPACPTGVATCTTPYGPVIRAP